MFRHTQSPQCYTFFVCSFSVVLLAVIANSCVSGIAAEHTLFQNIPALLTGAQLNFVSYLLFISVFEVDLTFWVRLTNTFWRTSLVPELYSTIMFIIFWDFLMVQQFFFWSEVKQSMVISNKLIYTSCLMSCRTTKDLGY